jgi:tRNA modification GTPase
MTDTIVALATAQGISAIAVIRLSGKDAIDIVQKLFNGKKLNDQPSHTIHFGTGQHL